ncbi:MAG: ChbG/HpnK family deacetylase [Prolixibacteraceae bacterium]|nr:ChbG/HpnK family deacetylase [Prolixibacteraceae bacterium]MDD4756619.1 ChbG/HpnK family deacetylase [Prolixibacteraceae bacterium]NLO01451.1 ChbG/HpnK family deacetylase [Bacteroidales bacterium]
MNSKLRNITTLARPIVLILMVLLLQNAFTSCNSNKIYLIVRGDDMGKNFCRTEGFIKSFEEGILRSASIMATAVYFDEAVKYCKDHPELAAGIHITLADGTQRPVLSPEEVPSLVNAKGFFFESADEIENPSEEEMEKEIRAQVKKARESGLHFVYLDWHRGVPPAAEQIIAKVCEDEKLIYGPTEALSEYGFTRVSLLKGENFPSVVLPDGQKAYYGGPANSTENEEAFYEGLSNLKPGKWITVIHPGWGDPNRASTTKILCSERTKEIINKKNIKLMNYNDLWTKEFGK